MADAPTNPAQLRAALEHLEAVQAQRLAERIAAGEVISVPLYVVAGSQTALRSKVEEAKANAIAALRATGDQREVVWTGTVVVTGVRSSGEVADPASVPSAPSFASPEDVGNRLPLRSEVKVSSVEVARPVKFESEEEAVLEEPSPALIESYIWVQIRRCHDDEDPGEIAEGWFSVDGKVLTVTDASGKYVGSRTMLKGEDARVVAKLLLREKSPEAEGFSRRLDYPASGLS
jgi:hypothetical protein